MSNEQNGDFPYPELEEATIGDLQAAMEKGELTALELTRRYLARIAAIDQAGPKLHSVIEVNPEAEALAQALDDERRERGPRGPLHGIPILVKDNIDTDDKMLTTAGSLALVGSRPAQDATVVARLREAGAVILGKANLSEWANFRAYKSSSGWSARGGQCRNPYILTHNPCGSSSGSGVAVSANLCVVALATETDGSIVCPAHQNGVVGVKPTVGLVSRAGVIPISHSQDTVGPHARTVRDAAILLNALVGPDPRDSATEASRDHVQRDYTQFLDPQGLKGARIGVLRKVYSGYNRHADELFEQAIATMRELGAEIVDPADLPTAEEIKESKDESTVLTYEFKAGLNAYLASRVPDPAHPDSTPATSLAEVIAFNKAHAAQEMPYFQQELLELSEECGPLTDEAYLTALANDKRRGGADGIDKVLADHKLDALIAPTGQPAWPTDLLGGDHYHGASSTPAAIVGYPLVTLPMGFAGGLPVGLTFLGSAYSEPTLLKLAYAFEQATHFRRPPNFYPDWYAANPE